MDDDFDRFYSKIETCLHLTDKFEIWINGRLVDNYQQGLGEKLATLLERIPEHLNNSKVSIYAKKLAK